MTTLPLSPPDGLLRCGFKGSRTYLQSADLWMACIEALFAEVDKCGWTLRMNFRALTGKAPLLLALDAARERPGRFAEVIAERGDQRWAYVLVESGEPVRDRYEDFEHILDPNVRISDDIARFSGAPVSSAMELIVFMTKKLHLQCVAGDVRWLATRLTFPVSFGETGEADYEVRLGPLIGKRASRSTVVVDGQAIGEIAFNAVQT